MQIGIWRVLFAVTTCKAYYEKTLPLFFRSLLDNGVPPGSIFCTLGGFEDFEEAKAVAEQLKSEYGIPNILASDHNSMEFGALIDVVENPEYLNNFDYLFLFHDTCWVGDKFVEALTELMPKNQKPPTIALRAKPSMNIGAYATDYLLAIKDKVMSFKNKSNDIEVLKKLKVYLVGAEDSLIQHFYGNFKDKAKKYKDRYESGPLKNPFGSSTRRQLLYFDYLDLYKAQSNFEGYASPMNIDL